MSFNFHIAFPVDSEISPYAVSVKSTSNNKNHRVSIGSSLKSDLRVGSGADFVIKIAPAATNFFEFTPFPNNNFRKWLENRKIEDIGPADFYTSGKSDGLACALAWLLVDRQQNFDENDGLPVIFASCAIEKDVHNPDFIIKRVADDKSGTEQLKQKWKTVSKTAENRSVIFVLHNEDAELLLKQIDPIKDVFIVKNMNKETLPLLCRKNSKKICIIKADSDDFDLIADLVGADSKKFEKDYEIKEKINDILKTILSPTDKTNTGAEEEKLEKLIQQNTVELKTVFESNDEGQKIQTLILLKNLASKKPCALEWLLQTNDIIRSLADNFRKKSREGCVGYDSKYASSLRVLSFYCRQEGRFDESVEYIVEAVKIRRHLCEKNTEKFAPDLAGGLNSISNLYRDMLKFDLALETSREAIAIYRTLAEKNSKKYRHVLAGTLNSISETYRKAGQYENALNAAKEAAELYRALVFDDPVKYKPILSGTLNSISNLYRDMLKFDLALETSREAIAIYRTLAEKNSKKYRHVLAGTLNSISETYRKAGQYENALNATKEAAELYRALVFDDPAKYKPILIGTLNCLKDLYNVLGKKKEAKNTTNEVAFLLKN
ncbi:MAG TPA: tetratricopeptide repeat protein [bacterium]|nr:tetratricopeptide repeat protein [bacterium]